MAKKTKLLEGLNPEQKKAVTHRQGPLLIVAGAGTGKTTVITRRIAHLIEQGTKPDEILALAFGEKAAAEMEERVDNLLPLGYVNIQISTYHSFCQDILREHGLEIGLPDFKVLDGVGQWLLARNNLDKFNLDYYRPLGNPSKFISALLRHFSRLKDEYISPEEYLDYAEKLRTNQDQAEAGTKKARADGDEEQALEIARIEEVANAFHAYQKLLLDNSALDFGDLINYTLELFRKRPKLLSQYRQRFKYILVDEFQDTNLAQYELLKLLGAPDNNITVVGDDDQSIFKFRGASISNILHFKKDYSDAEFINLTANYRSKQNLLDAAYSFIRQNNPDRLEVKLKFPKKLKSAEKGTGVFEHLQAVDYLQEADLVVEKILDLMKDQVSEITYNDFAVLARSHSVLEAFMNKFDALGIPYIYFANKGLYNKPIIIDLLAYFRLLDNYHESSAVLRTLRMPFFKISPQTIVNLSHMANRRAWSLFESIRKDSKTEIDDESRAGLRTFLQFLDKHSELATKASADEVFVEVVNDLGFPARLSKDTHEGHQNRKYLESFRRRIQDFQNESPDKSINEFIKTLALEQEAGEAGDVEFDPEAGPEAVKLMTVHAAKGLEFKYVFVVSMVDKRFPTIERSEPIEIPAELVKEILPEGDAHLQEERRLFYVAMTRAKEGLYLMSAKDYGGKRAKKPSRFLHELGFVDAEIKKPTGKVELEKTGAKGERGIKGEKGMKAAEAFRLPIPKSFSFSQVSLFKRCPLEYKYKALYKLPLPGSPQQSFGITIHAALEKYLRYYMQSINAPDLFGQSNASGELPSVDLLDKYYEESWIDDWYKTKRQKEEYRSRGKTILRVVHEYLKQNPPRPKYLEKNFKIKLGDYYFAGKIDRIDETEAGLLIIDYKTGEGRDINKVDKDQLLIYQIAAKEALGMEAADLQYWFLHDTLETRSFVGEGKQLEKVKAEILETIEEILEATENDGFAAADSRKSHECRFKLLET